jgi:hypothetical protein
VLPLFSYLYTSCQRGPLATEWAIRELEAIVEPRNMLSPLAERTVYGYDASVLEVRRRLKLAHGPIALYNPTKIFLLRGSC